MYSFSEHHQRNPNQETQRKETNADVQQTSVSGTTTLLRHLRISSHAKHSLGPSAAAADSQEADSKEETQEEKEEETTTFQNASGERSN